MGRVASQGPGHAPPLLFSTPIQPVRHSEQMRTHDGNAAVDEAAAAVDLTGPRYWESMMRRSVHTSSAILERHGAEGRGARDGGKGSGSLSQFARSNVVLSDIECRTLRLRSYTRLRRVAQVDTPCRRWR